MSRQDARSQQKTFTGVLVARPDGVLGVRHALHLLEDDGDEVEIERDDVSRPLFAHLGWEVCIYGRLRGSRQGPATLRVWSYELGGPREKQPSSIWDWLARRSSDWDTSPWGRRRSPWGEGTP